jgi:hypothetical protein
MTAVTIFMGLPAVLGTLIASTRVDQRWIHGWVTFMVVSLAIELVLTIVVMALT